LHFLLFVEIFEIGGPYSQHFILFVTYGWAQWARVFVPGMLFQPNQIFVGKARSLPKSGAPEVCFTWEGSGLIRLGWTFLLGTIKLVGPILKLWRK